MSNTFTPNLQDKVNHIFKIVCGAGKHSNYGPATLKKVIPTMLINNGYEFYGDMKHGYFLVRFCRNQKF